MTTKQTAKAPNFEDLLKALSQVSEKTDEIEDENDVADDDKVVGEAAEEGGEAGDGEDFGKSTAANEEDEYVDATDLIKSMIGRQDASEGVLAKALGTLGATLSKQNTLIKSLQEEVGKLASQGRGRKTMLTIADRPGIADTLAKSSAAEDAAITPKDLLAKSHEAHAAKKISGVELNTIDVCLRNNWPIDAGILQRVALA